MQSNATNVEEYCHRVPPHQAEAFHALRAAIHHKLPQGYSECMNYGMIGYVIPHTLYPAGYHCDPHLPLPCMGLAYQKNSINFYHMGIYADPELLQRFQSAYPNYTTRKLSMGKSCIRFTHYGDIPYELIGELVSKMSAERWIELYEAIYKRNKTFS